MEIHTYPDPVLKKPAEKVRDFGSALAALAEGMVRTMLDANGLGLAAPQVGASVRVAVVSPDGVPGNETVMVNPEIVFSDGWMEADEGCLSFPGVYARIGRFLRVKARYHDLHGLVREMEAEGLLARAIQHELDHLDGRLLVDRMSEVQRATHRRRLQELQQRHHDRAAQAEAGQELAR